jgi:hypothetical protein
VIVVRPDGSHAAYPGAGAGPLEAGSVYVSPRPLHGDLSLAADGFHYEPRADFWSLGSDTFGYGDRSARQTVTVVVVAGSRSRDGFLGFEAGEVGGWSWSDAAGRLVVDYRAAIGGGYGLALARGTEPAYLSYRGPAVDGDGGHGSSTGVKIRIPPRLGGPGSQGGQVLALLGVGSDPGPPALQVLLSEGDGGYGIWMETPRRDATLPIAVAGAVHHLRLEAWPDPVLDGSGGARLYVDERVAGELRDLAGGEGWDLHLFGAMSWPSTEVSDPSVHALDLDNLEVSVGPGEAPLIRAESFESEPLDWDDANGGGLRVTRAAAISGAGGLELPVAPSRRGHWVDPSPGDVARFNLRFRLEQTDIGGEVYAAGPLSLIEAPGLWSTPVLDVRWSTDTGRDRLEVRAGGDDGRTASVDLPWDGRSCTIEIQWRSASGPAAADGLLRVWKDGRWSGERRGLANHRQRVHDVRVGVLGSAGGDGVLALDDYQTWR